MKHFPKDDMIVSLIRAGVPKSVMSPFPKERLSDEQVADVVAYIRTLSAPPAKADKQTPACKPGKGGKTTSAGAASGASKGNYRQPHR